MIRRSGLTRSSVFSQKLPDTYKSTDVTDDKSVATLPPSFDIMKKGKPFNIDRPQFKMGTPSAIVDESKRGVDISKLNKRSGLGNNTILRDSFRTPDVYARQPVDYALQEIIDRQQQGIKVQLGDKTLQDMFEVKTVDPQDLDWIAEYNRRIAAGESKEQLKAFPPFGREQRVMFKRVNFGSGVSLFEASALSTSEEIKLLRDAVTGGPSSADVIAIAAKVLEISTKFETFTLENATMLADILSEIKAIDPDPRKYFGFDKFHRFWDVDQYRADFAKVNNWLCQSKDGHFMPAGCDALRPILSDAKKPSPILLSSLATRLATGARSAVYDSDPKGAKVAVGYKAYSVYLDIVQKQLVSRDYVISQVSPPSLVDDGLIGGKPPPSYLVDGGGEEVGTWKTTAEEDALSSATTKVDPKDPFKKPEPKTPEPKPSGSDPSPKRDPRTTAAETRDAIIRLRAKKKPDPTLPTTPTVTVYKESQPDIVHNTYENDEAKNYLMDGKIYQVGKKFYRKDA